MTLKLKKLTLDSHIWNQLIMVPIVLNYPFLNKLANLLLVSLTNEFSLLEQEA